MKIFAIACLAAACATAGAEPQPAAPAKPAPAPARKPPPPKGCVARGTPMVEIDHKADAGAKLATSSFKIYDSGAWTFDSRDAEGKASEPRRGCFEGDDRKAVHEDAKVPWKTTTARIHCMAYSSSFVEYRVNGKLVYTGRMCNGITLDDASQKAVTDLDARATAAEKG